MVDRLHPENRCSSLILLNGASLTSGIAQLLTEISTKLMNEQGRLAGEGSELMHGVLRGQKSAYFGCFFPSSPEIFRSFILLPWKGNDFAFKLSARPIILEFIDVIVV